MLYRARIVQPYAGGSCRALIPQVFGDTLVTITRFADTLPQAPEMGWVSFEGTGFSYPVWLGSDTAAAGVVPDIPPQDHGTLTGLGDDDHPQYHNDARGDARYAKEAFKTLVVAGQSDVVADALADTLTIVAGTGMAVTTNAGTDTVSFASTVNGWAGSYPAVLADLAAEVTNRLVPAGTIHSTTGATADTGYLLLDGTTVTGGQTTYPALWARIPASWKSGANILLPDARGRMLVMDDAGATFTLGALAGSTALTIASANLPTHTHVLDHDHGSVTSGDNSVNHTHSIDHDHAVVTSTGRSATHYHTVYQSGTSPVGYIMIAPPGGGTAINVLVLNGTAGSTGLPLISGTESAEHTHNVDLPNHTGTSGTGSVVHQHSVDLPNFTGNTGNGGFANTALTIPTPPSLVVNFQIKAH